MVIAPPDPALVQAQPPRSPGALALALTVSPALREGSVKDGVLRLIRTLVVGAWSSAVDLLVLAMCVRWFQVDATASRVIALLVSGLLLFWGCRSFAFRARAGSVTGQARRFVLAELMGFPLNMLVFHGLAVTVPFIAPELTSQAANFVVFVGFSYPVRRWLVFSVAR